MKTKTFTGDMPEEKTEGVDVEALAKLATKNNARIVDIESRMSDLEGIKNPLSVEGRIASIFGQIEELTDKVSVVMQKMRAYDFDEKFLEMFTDEELYKFYEKSGLKMNEIKDFLSKYFFSGEKVSISTASNYVNGKTDDLKIRSSLGKYLRSYVAKK